MNLISWMGHREVNFLHFGPRRSNSDGEIRCQMSKYKCNELDFGHFIPRHVHRDDEIVLTKLDSNAIFITYILFFSLV